METKKSKVIKLIRSGEFKKALNIMKNFRREFTKDACRDMQIAYECWDNSSRRNFYDSIQVDHVLSIIKSKQLMSTYAK